MREMKDSNISSFGFIPSDWEIKKLKTILTLRSEKNSGGRELLSVYLDRGVISYSDSTGMQVHKPSQDLSNYQNVYVGDFVLNNQQAWRGSVGVSKYDGIISPAYFVYRIAECCYPEYMNYLFRDSSMVQQYEISSRGVGTIQRNIFAPWLMNCLTVLPPLNEQKRIASHLNRVCAEIDSLTYDIQAQIDTLEQYKRSVVFRTVSQGITHAAMKKTDSNVWTTIPSNWDLADIKYLFEIVKRIAGKEGYDILSVTQRGLKVKDISSNEGQIANDYSGYQLVYPTDFVMNHMDLLTGWVDCSTQLGVTSPDYRVFILRDKERNNLHYFKYVMQCCYMCRIFYSLGQGVSQLGRWRLQTSAFNNFKVPVPPTETQLEIAIFLDTKIAEIDSIIDKKKEQLSILETYKKSLIYEYVTGKKEVPVQ